jgi:hypothetical protein
MRRSRHLRLLAGSLMMAAVTLSPTIAHSQTAQERAQAQMLFDEGRKLVSAGKIAEGCVAFEESQKLSSAIGTQLNLANCYEKNGRTASAWIMYREVETLARRDDQEEREELAKERADALEPLLSKLTVNVSKPLDGLKITRGGEEIFPAAWGRPIPIDPGKIVVEATAPGKKPWKKQLTIGKEADDVQLEIPQLEDDAAALLEDQPKTSPDSAESDDTLVLALGAGALVTGILASGAGVWLRFEALSTDEESLEHCMPNDAFVCTQQGQDLRDDAQGLETGSVIAWAAGGALLGAGMVVLGLTLTDDGEMDGDGKDDTVAKSIDWGVSAGPEHTGMTLRMHW